MSAPTTMKRTPFTEYHRAAGAKLVDFAGFEMPVRYTGDVREHQSVRTGPQARQSDALMHPNQPPIPNAGGNEILQTERQH